MATQSWVNPTFEYNENVPSTYMAREFEGPQHDVMGACVTLSCTLGINAARADGDEFMYPGLNVRPSERALQRSNPQFSFHDVDPLEREALPDQLFGHREEFPERGVTEGIDFGEHGAAVYMSGHCAYVRNDGDGVDVYDSGRHFFGDLDMYQRFTRQSLGSADFCEYVKVKTLTEERKDFISQCKRPFYDPAVQSRAREIFKLTIPSTRSEMQQKRYWLLTIRENGEIKGESFD